MTAVTWSNVCQFGLLSYLLLFPYISVTSSVSLDLTELRNKISKIKVNPRGNLWATGHFMGKKSVLDAPVQDNPADLKMDVTEAQKLGGLIVQDMPQTVQQTQPQDTSGKHYCENPEMHLLMKILERFIRKRK